MLAGFLLDCKLRLGHLLDEDGLRVVCFKEVGHHEVCLALKGRMQQGWQAVEDQQVVRVGHQDIFAGGQGYSVVAGYRQALVLLPDDSDVGMLLDDVADDLDAAVIGAVINDDDFKAIVTQALSENAFHISPNVVFNIVNGYDNTQ